MTIEPSGFSVSTVVIGLLLLGLGGGKLPGERSPAGTAPSAKILVAHRGASAYAPEHTLEAYRLALQHGADYIEPDLQLTRDGVLICLHDPTLERTTNVSEAFPDRHRLSVKNGQPVKQWFASDFTLEEIRRLDAGAWFGERFRGARIPTFEEVIQEVRGKAGLFPELKNVDWYRDQGFDLERRFVETLRKYELHRKGADPRTPVMVQSFAADSLRRLASEFELDLPLIQLIGGDTRLSPETLREIRTFASGIGPAKNLLLQNPAVIIWAHGLGLSVIPYTFRASALPPGFDTVREEMSYFLYTLGVDGLFTDHPDQFPRQAPSGPPPGR